MKKSIVDLLNILLSSEERLVSLEAAYNGNSKKPNG
jgi:hypothetical protein